jgi:uncharacterized LabA/DUF88 family protein
MEARDLGGRVAVFVDGANLYRSIKSYHKGILDYCRLLEAAVGGRKLLRATFYIVEKQESDDTQNTNSARPFVYNLNKFGHKVRSKPLQVHETPTTLDSGRTVSHEGDWDVGIVVDMMRLAAHSDAYVLASGDGDCVQAVEYLQSDKGPPSRGYKRRPVHLPGAPRHLRLPHEPSGYTGIVPVSQSVS